MGRNDSANAELFDPATRDRVRTESARGVRVVLIATTLAVGGLSGALHNEVPVLARAAGACSGSYAYDCERAAFNVLAGIVGLLLCGAVSFLVFRHRRIAPTVRCHSCGGRGWVMDLEPREGRCPRCAGSRFAYHTRLARGNALGPEIMIVDEPDVDGAALVRRFRETRSSLLDRFY